MGCQLLRTTSDRATLFVLGTAVVAGPMLLLPGAVDAQWVEAPGKGWISAEVYHHDTRDRYDLHGNKNAIPFDGTPRPRPCSSPHRWA